MNTVLVRLACVAVVAVPLALNTGCDRQSTKPTTGQTGDPAPPRVTGGAAPQAPARSAEPNSFREVTAHLEPGGPVYLYLSAEQWLAGASGKVEGWRNLILSLPELKPEDGANLGRMFDVMTHLLRQSGLEEVSGFGLSGVEVAKGVYRTKSILHHYKGRNAGYLWSMFGSKPHALAGLELCPPNAALAAFLDANPAALWKAVREAVAQANVPQVEDQLRQGLAQFEQRTGLNFESLLASFGGEFGLVLTLDASSTASIPLPDGGSLEIPEPALMLVAKVKDDLLFQRIDALLQNVPQVNRTTPKGMIMDVITLPVQMPFTLRPTIALAGDTLFLATTETIIMEALEARAGKAKGLKDTGEFKDHAAGVPLEGNSFSWISPRFSEAIAKVQQEVLSTAAAPGGENQAGAVLLEKLLAGHQAGYAFSVSANTEEGWLTTSQSTQHPAQIALAPLVAVPAVAASLALPAMAQARNRAGTVACISHLKQINLAKEWWADDQKKTAGAEVSAEELKPYLGNATLKCPQGGTYTINLIGSKPTCSERGHTLP